MIHLALASGSAVAAENTDTQDVMVVDGASSDVSDNTQGQHDYSVKTTRAGTKMLLTPRDVPQSVSVITKHYDVTGKNKSTYSRSKWGIMATKQ